MSDNDIPCNDEIVPDMKFLNSLIKGARNIFILWLISREKLHGYGLMSKINELSSDLPGDKTVHSSTIYPLLHKLEKDGLITSSQELNGNHKVKVYEITEDGLQMLNSIKYFIKQKREDNDLVLFFKDMILNDKVFTQNLGDE
ncbi:PadR family transcriptional regulator [Methanosphaera sp. WGK6]|uniref:PadR family transcriptional regulator n=1 Tax=Methanosphaera sp. WGK6 TaxID=1561964 RepID=UPI00084C6A47|nr:PadR family transcriptional regulator [Methanosphaera sp. WGK6]